MPMQGRPGPCNGTQFLHLLGDNKKNFMGKVLFLSPFRHAHDARSGCADRDFLDNNDLTDTMFGLETAGGWDNGFGEQSAWQ